MTQLERVHKEAIRRGNEAAIDAVARCHYMLVGLVAEAALRKILSDPAGFNDRERFLLGQERGQLARWKRAVEFAFRRHFVVPIHQDVDQFTTSAAAAAQYSTLIRLLDNDLAEVIEDRNKIAHAQWAWTLNNAETAFTGRAPPPLNYLQISRRAKLILNIAAAINDLVVSEPTFQRDFNEHYENVLSCQEGLAGMDYPAFTAELRARRRPPM
jgi:hypothetical protein